MALGEPARNRPSRVGQSHCTGAVCDRAKAIYGSSAPSYLRGMTDHLDELAAVLANLQNQHEVAPFLESWHSTSIMSFQPLPSEMEAVLRGSPDYSPPNAGVGPVWLQLETEERNGQLVVYRTQGDGNLYVLAPSSDR